MPSLPIVNAFLSDLIVCALLYTHELCHSHTQLRESLLLLGRRDHNLRNLLCKSHQ